MKFFIDTADLNEIREAASLGILDGVTTNPSLMAKVGITGADNDHIDIQIVLKGRPGRKLLPKLVHP